MKLSLIFFLINLLLINNKENFELKTSNQVDSEIEFAKAGDENIFVASRQFTYNIDLTDLRIIWKKENECAFISGIIELNNEIILSNWCGKLKILDKRNANTILEKSFPEAISKPFKLGEKIFILSKDTNIYCIRLNDYEVLWKKELGRPSYYWDEPFVAIGENVLVKAFKNNRFETSLIDGKNGEILWKVPFGFKKAKVYDDKVIFLLGENNELIYVINTKDGKTICKIISAEHIRDFDFFEGNILLISESKIYFYSNFGEKIKELILRKGIGNIEETRNGLIYFWDGRVLIIYNVGKNSYEEYNFANLSFANKNVEVIEIRKNFLLLKYKNIIYKVKYL